MGEKLTDKERLALELQVGQAQLLMEIRDLLLEVRNKVVGHSSPASEKHFGYSDLSEELDVSTDDLMTVLRLKKLEHLLPEGD